MRITRQDLPERIAEAYEAQLKEFALPPIVRLFSEPGETADFDSTTVVKREKARQLVSALETSDGSHILELYVALLIFVFDVAALIGAWFIWATTGGILPLLLFIAAVSVSVVFFQWCKRREQWRQYCPELLRAVLPLVAQTASEEMYVRALLGLAGRDDFLGESTERGLLVQLNALLNSSHEIGQQQEHIHAAMGGKSRAEVEAMRDDLASRVLQATDSEARETLRQTLLVCEARLTRADALAPLKERLEAQQEMIRQTLASVGESLAGLRLAPQVAEGLPFESVRESVEQIQRQARSIEQAVREVMSLRAL